MPLLDSSHTHPEKSEEDDGNDNQNTDQSNTGGQQNNNGEGGGSNTDSEQQQQEGDEEKKEDESKEEKQPPLVQHEGRVLGDGKEMVKVVEKPHQYPLVGEPPFPVGALEALDEQLNRLRWIVPVLADSDLEQLLRASIKLCRDGVDQKSEPCQKFFSEGLMLSFKKIMQDDAVVNWKEDIQKCILNCSRLAIEVCAVKMDQDWFVLLDLLALVLNPLSKWNCHNCRYDADTYGKDVEEHKIFAKPTNPQFPKGWLVDLINLFGMYGGFERFHNRIVNGSSLNVTVIAAMIKPFGQCAEFLSPMCIEMYISPVMDKVLTFMDSLMDDALKKEAASESKSDTFSSIMKSLRYLSRRTPGRDDVEAFRLKMILRLLKISSFSGKMNALNEINKIIPSHHQMYSYQQTIDEEHMTADRLAAWIKNNSILSIVLRDNLHQPQYVEKLEKILRFCIKEHSLSVEDLDAIWDCQEGKHEAIVKNIHDLLARLAWDFSADQLDHLFGCFQKSWVGASKKQRDDLLVFIRHLAEDDKEGVMAVKVLGLLWNLAHREDCPTDTMDHALTAHLKILDYSCSQDRENQRVQWLTSCMEELMNNTWVLPALKQMEEIFGLFPEMPVHFANQHRSSSHFYYRNDIITQFDTKYHLLTIVANNLETYLDHARGTLQRNQEMSADEMLLDGRYNHHLQVHNRLEFMRFVLRDGQLWLGHAQALTVWNVLVENPAFDSDREACFRWFARLVSDEPDIEGETAKKLLTENVMMLKPSVLSEYGFRCFDRFFRHVNQSERRIVPWRRNFLTESVDLTGLEYLWNVVLTADPIIANKAIELLKDIFTNLSSKLQQERVHDTFIRHCMEILSRTLNSLQKYSPEELANEDPAVQESFTCESVKLIRCLTLLKEYAGECDEEYPEERAFASHGRSMWGRMFIVVVRCIVGHSRPPEDIELCSHSTETVAALRRHIQQRLKMSASSRLELSVNNEMLHMSDDKKLVSTIPLRNGSVVTAKVITMTASGENSSVESSESSPEATPQPVIVARPNHEAESLLPSVIISNTPDYIDLLIALGDFALVFGNLQLRDATRVLLRLIPSDRRTVKLMVKHCQEYAVTENGYAKLRSLFVAPSIFRTMYHLEVCHSLLMPSVDFKDAETLDFQVNFIKSGGIQLLLDILSDNRMIITRYNVPIMRSSFLSIVKMCKLLFISISYATIQVVAKTLKNDPTNPSQASATILQKAIHAAVPSVDMQHKTTALHISQNLMEELLGPLPTLSVVENLQRIAWAAAVGGLGSIGQPEQVHELYCQHTCIRPPEVDDTNLVKESLEVLTYAFALVPSLLLQVQQKPFWKMFVTDILLRVKTRNIRSAAADQFFFMTAYCTQDPAPLTTLLTLLVDSIETIAKEHPNSSGEYFRLLAKLFNHAQSMKVAVSNTEKLLHNELQWLSKIREESLAAEAAIVEGPLLEGHINFAVELLSYQPISFKYLIGSKPGGQQLIQKLIRDFLFPSSTLVVEARTKNAFDYEEKSSAAPICSTSDSTTAAFKLLTALSSGCLENLRTLCDLLHNLFYSGHDPPVLEWEYIPHIGSRPIRGFVGLKNAGATCYMNSVLQQLYMIPDIRKGIVSVEKTSEYLENLEKEEIASTTKKATTCTDGDVIKIGPNPLNELSEESPSKNGGDGGNNVEEKNEQRKDVQKKVFVQLQSIFGHLLQSRVQFYAPRGMWKDFRLWGEPVNLREQHDAFEFFNCLADLVDEGLKTFDEKPLVSKVLGGTFADQKICKGCPHRYSREEPFTALNVDVRNHDNLAESLDTFVKGDLLEGANAYHCEKCDKKIDTVKRLCIKKLPQILVIQLKRFDYDWERECAVKFNDYFEFPREVDMSPYTAATLAKHEGEVIPSNTDASDTPTSNEIPAAGDEKTDDEKGIEEVASCKDLEEQGTVYRLRGIVVHSGQASGGHYYSFISHSAKWYKFDDNEVSECKMDNDEELRAQCFGGEYTGEVYDHVMRRTQYRRQKRWWSAYLLFYERIADTSLCEAESLLQIPFPIRKAVQKQNLEFVHHKAHFSHSYFLFIKQLLLYNAHYVHQCIEEHGKLTEEYEEIALLCVKLASEFLFSIGLRTKKPLRGPANDWFEAFQPYFNASLRIRRWFADNMLLKHPMRIPQYLLECPSAEVRNMFAKLLVYLCNVSNEDGPYPLMMPNADVSEVKYLSQAIFEILLVLLKKEVQDNSRHLHQYFQVFLAYSLKGPTEKQLLLQLGVVEKFVTLCLNERAFNLPYIDYTKLFAVVSILLRCYDLTLKQQNCDANKRPFRNPFADPDVQIPLTNDLNQLIFDRTKIQRYSNYFKKIIDDSNQADGTILVIKHCCWENFDFSLYIMAELMQQVAVLQTFDLRPIFDLLKHVVFLEDSWLQLRVEALLKGIPERMESIMDIIQQAKQRHQKRAYLCIKLLVNIFYTSQLAVQLVYEDAGLRKAWRYALIWLNSELEKKPFVSSAYSYANWSPPAQSNEVSNGYYLERSNSAKITLKRAVEIFPIVENTEEDSDGGRILPGGDPDAGMPAHEADLHGIDRSRLPEHQVSQDTSISESLDHIDEEDDDSNFDCQHFSTSKTGVGGGDSD